MGRLPKTTLRLPPIGGLRYAGVLLWLWGDKKRVFSVSWWPVSSVQVTYMHQQSFAVGVQVSRGFGEGSETEMFYCLQRFSERE